VVYVSVEKVYNNSEGVRDLKRILTAILAAAMVLAFAPIAHAQIIKNQYYARSTLSGSELEYYDATYEGFIGKRDFVDESDYGLTDERATKIYNFVYQDSPEIFNAYGYYSSEELIDLENQLNEKSEEILSLVSYDMSEVDKFSVVYTFLGEHIEYDYETEQKREDPADSKEASDSRTIIGGLINGKAICAGMACSLQYILYQLDIVSYRVTSEDHMWNIVKLDGDWYHTDLSQYKATLALDPYYRILRDDSFLDANQLTPNEYNPPLPACTTEYHGTWEQYESEPTPTPTPTPEPTEQAVEVNVLEPTETPAEGLANRDNGLLPWVGGLAAVLVALVVLLIRRKRK
jgi:hypothetical protein